MSGATRKTIAAGALFGLGLGIASLLPVPAFAQSASPDPFYTGLLRDGRTALSRGNAAEAAEDLRLACFGLLDFPAMLAECRMRLGLAQIGLDDKDGFLETFSRLEELEERFQVYSAAAVSAEERRQFEEKALEWVSPEILRSIPAFAPILARKAEIDFAKLAPKERTKELEKRVVAEPGEARWRVLLAEDELGRKRPAPALARLEKLADDAQGGRVGCIRGEALAALDRCAEAVAPLGACANSTTDPRLAILQIDCLIDLEQGDAARAFAGRLDKAVAARPEVKKRISKIPAPPKLPPAPKPDARSAAQAATATRKPIDAKKDPPAASATSAQPKSEKPPVPAATTSRAAAKPTAAEQSRVNEARRLLRDSGGRADIERSLAALRPIADRYPAEADLQNVVGELGYRAGQWATGATYFRRGNSRGPADPTLRFYYAVCLFESGDRVTARQVASSGLEKLTRSPFVDNYLKRIQAP